MHNLKTNAHLTVRARWYDWRQSTITQLIPNLIKTREGLMAVSRSRLIDVTWRDLIPLASVGR
jgi:hypothetical protein